MDVPGCSSASRGREGDHDHAGWNWNRAEARVDAWIVSSEEGDRVHCSAEWNWRQVSVSWWLAECDIIYVLFLGVVSAAQEQGMDQRLEQRADSRNQKEDREIQLVREWTGLAKGGDFGGWRRTVRGSERVYGVSCVER